MVNEKVLSPRLHGVLHDEGLAAPDLDRLVSALGEEVLA
jgi:hypothetical protein